MSDDIGGSTVACCNNNIATMNIKMAVGERKPCTHHFDLPIYFDTSRPIQAILGPSGFECRVYNPS